MPRLVSGAVCGTLLGSKNRELPQRLVPDRKTCIVLSTTPNKTSHSRKQEFGRERSAASMPSKPPPPPKPIPNKKHTLTLKTDKKTSSFGLTVRGTTVSGEAHVFVTSVESDGANVKSGLKVGDEFIKVAGWTSRATTSFA